VLVYLILSPVRVVHWNRVIILSVCYLKWKTWLSKSILTSDSSRLLCNIQPRVWWVLTVRIVKGCTRLLQIYRISNNVYNISLIIHGWPNKVLRTRKCWSLQTFQKNSYINHYYRCRCLINRLLTSEVYKLCTEERIGKCLILDKHLQGCKNSGEMCRLQRGKLSSSSMRLRRTAYNV